LAHSLSVGRNSRGAEYTLLTFVNINSKMAKWDCQVKPPKTFSKLSS
jgi:hypothetical protein